MYSDKDLEQAAQSGIFKHSQVAEFKEWAQGPRSEASLNLADEEQFRLVSGFNDIFVVIAATLLLLAVSMIGNVIHDAMSGVFVAVSAWALAEYFVRQKRMALPAIVLMLWFVGGVAEIGFRAISNTDFSPIGASGLALIAAYLHWRRFKVPITIAAIAGAAVALLVTLSIVVFALNENAIYPVTLLTGTGVFILAMYWDMQDLERVTRKSDVAFWLHLLAAPLVVHSIFMSLGITMSATSVSWFEALVVLITYLFIAVVSIAVDRRALMVSSLIYVLITFSQLLKDVGVVSLSFAVTAFLVGGTLLVLSIFWHQVRARVVGLLPETFQQQLVPVRAGD
ncbi:MAG: putative membrane protein (DUF2339) [Idiomarinaceae bacterium HL-53]|nr:MAG: putative membrane protein (DUF2339) [Idiomarinaceae bacterium HL-53]CUS48479.1 hypothetical protein Ga0003345_1435 [Idiomarinaceae bacterium HL-53]